MDQQPNLYNRFTNSGPISQGGIGAIPSTGAIEPAPHKNEPAAYGIVRELNARRDLNMTHDFQYWVANDGDINDWNAFMGIQAKIIRNRSISNFLGEKSYDMDDLSVADLQFYEDFLGGFFKKVGHAISGAAKDVGKVATDVAHAGRDLGLDVAHGTRDVADDVAHTAAHIATPVIDATGHIIAHGAIDIAHGTRSIADDVAHDARSVAKAVGPYWKDIAALAVMGALMLTGVGIPIALAIGGSLLTALNSGGTPQTGLPVDFGTGMGLGGDGAGVPTGDDDGGSADPDDATGDTGENLTLQQVAMQQEQAQEAQAAQEQAFALAKHKKKILIIGGSVIVAIVIFWWIKRK